MTKVQYNFLGMNNQFWCYPTTSTPWRWGQS